MTASDAIAIFDVRPATAAARARLARGDRILAVDGHAVGATDLISIRERFAATDADEIALRIERDGVVRDVSLALDDYVVPAV